MLTEGKRTQDTDCCNSISPTSKSSKNNLLFICYLFLSVFWGVLEVTHYVLFKPLEKQLNTTATSISFIMISCLISFLLSAIIASIVLDIYQSTHYYIGLISLIACISLCIIPSTNNILFQCLLWAVVGYAIGVIEVALPVYTFRVSWSSSPQNTWFVFLSIFGISKTIIPIFIQLSISRYNTFSYALYALSIFGIVFVLFAISIPTPQHDPLRSIRNALAKRKCDKGLHEVMQEMKTKEHVRNSLISIFGLILVIFLMIQTGMVTFITSYCEDYLKYEHVGRYLIASYFCGQLSYRMLRSLLPQRIKEQLVHSQTFAFKNLFFGYGIFVICMLIWIYIPKQYEIIVLFIIFGVSGFVLSGSYPLMHELCESITPISGVISCIFTLCIGVGDIMMTKLMSWINDNYGIHLLVYPLIMLGITQIFILFLTKNLYRNYKDYESLVMSASNSRLKTTDLYPADVYD